MARQPRTLQAAVSKPEDESGADMDSETVDSTPAKTRKTVSKRSYIDSDGKAVEKMEAADGARYLLLGNGGKAFDYQYGENEHADKGFAIFGFHTKIGNVANTVLNDSNEPGTPSDAADAIEEFLAALADGTWAERTGGVGAKIDLDVLADSVVAAYAAEGIEQDRAKIRAKLNEKGNVTKFRANPEIYREYNSRIGKSTKTLAELAALIA